MLGGVPTFTTLQHFLFSFPFRQSRNPRWQRCLTRQQAEPHPTDWPLTLRMVWMHLQTPFGRSDRFLPPARCAAKFWQVQAKPVCCHTSRTRRVKVALAWVMMIRRLTHALSLFLAFFISGALARTRSPSFSLFFPLSLLSWYFLIKIEFLDISCQSWWKTLFLLMFGKVYIYLNTHLLTRSQQYPPSHKCHINTPFLRVRYQDKKTPKSHVNSLSDAIRHCPYDKQEQASSGYARLQHSSDCSKPVHNYFLKKLYWTRSQLVSVCSVVVL